MRERLVVLVIVVVPVLSALQELLAQRGVSAPLVLPVQLVLLALAAALALKVRPDFKDYKDR
ncbi:hypothetical protein [Methylobacterium sp. Leaf91]|uniref:hypothetical protein n=1 Tax=Methylobacterium sp. Leaf91 TaxID=1736247 RepID=UPI0006FB2567|nr:hypothetical protein [Methylobacterium sp. Leaf91]KQO99108.1 hypothetical protein ASF32_14740 [Methylobacterium sp. Leaf91]